MLDMPSCEVGTRSEREGQPDSDSQQGMSISQKSNCFLFQVVRVDVIQWNMEGGRTEVVAGSPSVGGVRDWARASALGLDDLLIRKKMARDRELLDVLTASHEYSSMPIVNQKGMPLR